MKTIFSLLTFAFIFAPLANAESGIDFSFNIKGDRFHLEINQKFNQPLLELRKKYSPLDLPKISNLVRSVKYDVSPNSTSKISIRSSKYGIPNTTVIACNEKMSDSELNANCSLDIDSGDTGDFFNFGTENIYCNNTATGSACKFIMDASVKYQKKFIFYRSSEVLALGGILERIHDQAVLSRVINLKETPSIAFHKFEQTNMSTCLDKIYSTFEDQAQKMEFKNSELNVQSNLWRCNP
jgi:hypothetical protein